VNKLGITVLVLMSLLLFPGQVIHPAFGQVGEPLGKESAPITELNEALLNAAASGQADVVEALLERGANIEAKNNLGATPLIFAAVQGHSRVVKLLLGRGADVNAKTATGITPLIGAASAADADVVQLLLEDGADVSVKDQQGHTALDMAEATGDTQVYALLRSADKTSGRLSAPVAGSAGPSSALAALPTGQVHVEIIRQADSPGGLTVRDGPSQEGRAIAYLPVGSKVTYSEEASNGWVRLSGPTAGGWVAESYLGSRNPEALVVDVDNPEQCLRVRNGPGTGQEKIGCLPRGARIKLTGTVQNNWAQIFEPMAGWVTVRQIQAPGLFPATPATSGVAKERRGASGGPGYRRQQSDRDSDFEVTTNEIDQQVTQLSRKNEGARAVAPWIRPLPRGIRMGPFGLGPPFH